jgi:hypothetical protein
MGTRQEPSPWAGLGLSQQTHGWVLILKTQPRKPNGLPSNPQKQKNGHVTAYIKLCSNFQVPLVFTTFSSRHRFETKVADRFD